MIVRQGIVIGGVLFISFLIQVTLLSRLGLPGATPDLLVVSVVAVALAMGPIQGAFAGFLAGVIIDVSPPADTVVGVNSIVYLGIGFLAGYVVDDPRSDGPRNDRHRFHQLRCGGRRHRRHRRDAR